MGCASSQQTVTINVDAANWNVAYEETTRKLSRRRSSSKISRGLLGESSTALIEKKGNQLERVNDYIITGALGKGAYGEVFKAKSDGEHFAVKVLKKSALKKMRTPGRKPPGRPGGKPGMATPGFGKSIGAEVLDSVKMEIATMKKITHPNCVQMFDVILDPSQDEVFIVLEFVDGGTSQPLGPDGVAVPLPDRTIWSHLRHLVMGLEYLHMHGIIHRDIKPDNLLVTRPGAMYEGGAGILKIADFGTSCLCEGDANAQKTAGTPTFFSPELCSIDAAGARQPPRSRAGVPRSLIPRSGAGIRVCRTHVLWQPPTAPPGLLT